MKTVEVTLTFDILNEQDIDVEGVRNYIAQINEFLSEKFPYTDPQLILDEKINIKVMNLSEYLTVEQIVDAARNEIKRCINNGNFVGNKMPTEDEENFHTIEALYVQWAEDEMLASEKLWEMFEEEFSQYL